MALAGGDKGFSGLGGGGSYGGGAPGGGSSGASRAYADKLMAMGVDVSLAEAAAANAASSGRLGGGNDMGALGLGLGPNAEGPGTGFGGTSPGAQASAGQQAAVGLGTAGSNDASGTGIAGLGTPGGGFAGGRDWGGGFGGVGGGFHGGGGSGVGGTGGGYGEGGVGRGFAAPGGFGTPGGVSGGAIAANRLGWADPMSRAMQDAHQFMGALNTVARDAPITAAFNQMGRDEVANLVAREGITEGVPGMTGIANTMMNRAIDQQTGGSKHLGNPKNIGRMFSALRDRRNTVQAPPGSKAHRDAARAMREASRLNTGLPPAVQNATHYFSPQAMNPAGRVPGFAQRGFREAPFAEFGRHQFGNTAGAATAAQMAAARDRVFMGGLPVQEAATAADFATDPYGTRIGITDRGRAAIAAQPGNTGAVQSGRQGFARAQDPGPRGMPAPGRALSLPGQSVNRAAKADPISPGRRNVATRVEPTRLSPVSPTTRLSPLDSFRFTMNPTSIEMHDNAGPAAVAGAVSPGDGGVAQPGTDDGYAGGGAAFGFPGGFDTSPSSPSTRPSHTFGDLMGLMAMESQGARFRGGRYDGGGGAVPQHSGNHPLPMQQGTASPLHTAAQREPAMWQRMSQLEQAAESFRGRGR